MLIHAKRAARLLFLLAGLLAAAGCAGRPAAQTPLAALDPSAAVLQSPTPSPMPTRKAEASATWTVMPFPTPNLQPTPTPTSSVTPPGRALFRASAGFPDGQSTDGQWLWRIESGEHGFLVTHLVKKDGSQEWSLQFRPQEFPNQNFDRIYLVPAFWLPKEPFVFLNGLASGSCPAEVFTLRRFNLKSGALTTVLPGSVCQEQVFSFSHTGRYLLSGLPDLPGLQLQRLSDGQVTQVRLPTGSGRVTAASWSPDETRVVVEACRKPQAVPDSCMLRALYLIEAEEGITRPLLADTAALKLNDQDYWEEIFWLSANRVSIHMLSGGVWNLNLVNRQLFCRGAEGGNCRRGNKSTPMPGGDGVSP